MSLSFRLIMIWSLTAASSAVQSIDVNFKLQCLASSNMGLQKAIKVSPSYCMFNRKWKGFSIIFSVGLKYAVVALTKSHQCVFFLFSPLVQSYTNQCTAYWMNTFLGTSKLCHVISFVHKSYQIVLIIVLEMHFQVLLLFSTVRSQLLKIPLEGLDMCCTVVRNVE